MQNPLSFAADRKGLILGILIVAVSAVLWPPLGLFVLPGTLLVFVNPWKRNYLSDHLPYIMGTSMSFWIVSFWFLNYLPVPLTTWAYVGILITAVLFGIAFWKNPAGLTITLDRREVFVLLLLGTAVSLRLSVFFRWPLPPAGADMSMHSYMAALIVHYNGPPPSHYPILPIQGFGGYAAGFQTLTALMSLLGGNPVFRTALLMEAITFGFLTLSFYAFLRIFWSRETSALGALLVSFLPSDPQSYIVWGGIPTVLSLSFIVMSLALLPALKEKMSIGVCFIYALIASASILTHLVPVISSFYALLPVALYMLIRGTWVSGEEARVIFWNVLRIGLATGLLLLPYIPNFLTAHVSVAEIDFVKDFQRHLAGGAWGGTLKNAVITIPKYLARIYGWIFVVLGILGSIFFTLRWRRLAVLGFIFSAAAVALVINSMYWIIPFSYAIYPERTALLLLLPFSFGIASLIDWAQRQVPKQSVLWTMALCTLFIAVRQNEDHFYKTVVKWSAVTEADMKAMRWIERNTKPEDVFRNSYGNAGLWIPAIAFRPITEPHLNPFYSDEFKEGSKKLEANYVYIGAKTVYGEPFAKETFESRSDIYRRVYDSDGVTIYRVTNHASALH